MKKTIWKSILCAMLVTLTTCITITGWKFRFGSKPFEVGQKVRLVKEPDNEYADCQKTFVGANIARLCPFACEKNLPGKGVAAPSWRANNVRPYILYKAK